MSQDSRDLRPRYPGARSFLAKEADSFFGRDEEKIELLHQVLADDLVVVFGRSGYGKSSLIQAGLMPPLRTKGYFPFVARINKTEKGGGPSQAVYRALATAASGQNVEYSKPGGNKASLWHFFKTQRLWSEDTLLTPVLILDQFEELFHHEQGVRDDFIHDLARLVRGTPPEGWDDEKYGLAPGVTSRAPRVKIVLSLRSNFLANLDAFSTSLPNIFHSRFQVEPLRRDRARRAIEDPARQRGPGFRSPRFKWSPDALDVALKFLCESRTREGARVVGDMVDPFQLQLICQHVEDNVISKRAVSPEHARADEEDDPTIVLEVGPGGLGTPEQLSELMGDFYKGAIASVAQGSDRQMVLQNFCEQKLIGPRGRRLMFEETHIETEFGVTSAELQGLVDKRLLRGLDRGVSKYFELAHDTLVRPIEDIGKVRREADEKVREAEKKRRRALRRRGAALVGLGVVVVVLASFWARSDRSRDERRVRIAEHALYHEQDPTHAAIFLIEVSDSTGIPDWVQLATAVLGQPFPQQVLRDHTAGIRDLVLAEGDSVRRIVSASQDFKVGVWDIGETAAVWSEALSHLDIARVVRVTPSGDTIVSGARDGSVLWSAAGELHTLQPAGPLAIRDIAIGPGGRVAVTTKNSTVVYVGLENRNILRGGDKVSFSGDGTMLAIASEEAGSVSVLRATADGAWQLTDSFEVGGTLQHLDFTTGGRPLLLATSDSVGAVIWGQPMPDTALIGEHLRHAVAAAITADGRHLATVSARGSVTLFEARQDRFAVRARFEHAGMGSPDIVIARAPGSDSSGFFAATTWSDGSIRVWRIRGEEPSFVELLHRGLSKSVMSADGDLLVTASRDGTIRRWDLGLVADSMHLLVLRPIACEPNEARCVEWEHDPRRCSSPPSDSLRGEIRMPWSGPDYGATADGDTLEISCTESHAIVRTGGRENSLDVSLRTRSDTLRAMTANDGVFNEAGTRVLIATWDGAVVWELATGDEISLPAARGGQVNTVAFGPDDQVLTATNLGFQIWYEADGEYPPDETVFVDVDLAMLNAVFTEDGDVVLTSRDGGKHFYPASPRGLMTVLKERVDRMMSDVEDSELTCVQNVARDLERWWSDQHVHELLHRCHSATPRS